MDRDVSDRSSHLRRERTQILQISLLSQVRAIGSDLGVKGSWVRIPPIPTVKSPQVGALISSVSGGPEAVWWSPNLTEPVPVRPRSGDSRFPVTTAVVGLGTATSQGRFEGLPGVAP